MVVEPQSVELGTLRAQSPAELIASATSLATPLAKLIKDRSLAVRISGREYVKCEGWTTLGVMLGCTPHEVEVTEQDGIFTATVELRRMSDGRIVGRASAECGAPDELDRSGQPLWANRARYARRSMALTRATAKAYRLAFSWIMVLAGYMPTPAEEITDHDGPADRPEPAVSTPRLPGASDKWEGHGGKLINDMSIPDKTLAKVGAWLQGKDPAKNRALVDAINNELERRRSAELPDAVREADNDDLPF